MNCNECIGNGNCAYNIMLPYYVRFYGDTPVNPEAKYVSVDKCLLPEIVGLWEQGIKTTGCCCGHGDNTKTFIGVMAGCAQAMLDRGYSVAKHGWAYSFTPKTPLQYFTHINKGFNWWDENTSVVPL